MIDLVFMEEVKSRMGVEYSALAKHIIAGNLPPPRMLDGRAAWTIEELVAFIDGLPRVHPHIGGRGRPKGSKDKAPRERRWWKKPTDEDLK